MLTDLLAKYLNDTLNVTPTICRWEDQTRLPLMLRDEYAWYRAEVYGLAILVMFEAIDRGHAPSTIAKHIELVRKKWDGEVVYVRSNVNAYMRKRLIASGVQFVIPGNQMYLPALAIDLREHFRRGRRMAAGLSPAAQVLALFWIYHRDACGSERRSTTEMAGILGYSRMTMSRAFREIDGLLDEEFFNETGDGPTKNRLPARELWERLLPHWRNPVKRRIHVHLPDPDALPGLRAGLTALAARSRLAEPVHAVMAVSQEEWRTLGATSGLHILDQADAGSVEIEVWRYPPKLFAEQGLSGSVDPLSLYLSLKESRDERIEGALEELFGGMNW